MRQLAIDFEWSRDSQGYKRVPGPYPETDIEDVDWGGTPERIVRHGGKLVPYKPLEMIDTLYLVYASIKTANEAFDFVSRYGPLTNWGLDVDEGEKIPRILAGAWQMRRLVAHAKERRFIEAHVSPYGYGIGFLEASLVSDSERSPPRLALKPLQFETALFLQGAQALSSGATVRRCRHCGAWFECGPGTDRRLDAKFCSDEHRVAFNSLKRSKET